MELMRIAGIRSAAGCLLLLAPGAIASAQEKVTYDDHVQRILSQQCGKCHNEERAKAGLIATTYPGVIAGSSGGPVVVAGDPDESVLFLAISHRREPTMPPNRDKIPEEQIETIRRWIEGGLLENAGSQAKPKKKRSSLDLKSAVVTTARPSEPPPLPQDLLLEPATTSLRPGAITALAANPWSPLVALGAQKQVLLHDTRTLELLGVLPFPEGLPCVLSFSRDGRLLLAAGGHGAAAGRVVVWNVEDGRRVVEVGEEIDTILAADLCPDRSRVALGNTDKIVKVYATESGELLQTLRKHTDWITAVSYSPDAVLLATGDRNGNLSVWEAQTGREMHTLTGHTAAITGLAWRDDGNLLASVSEDGTLKLWEMFEGKQAKSWPAHAGGTLGVAMAHDGRLATCGRDRTVKTWSGDGQLQHTFEGLGDIALRVAFDTDGARVVAGDWSGTVRAWNVADGAVVGDLVLNPPPLAQRVAAAEQRVAVLAPTLEQATAARSTAEAAALDPLANLATARALEEASARHVQELEAAVAAIPEVPAAALLSTEERARLDLAVTERRALQGRLVESAAAVRTAATASPDDAALQQAAADAEQAAAHAAEAVNTAGERAATAARNSEDARRRTEAANLLAAAKAEFDPRHAEAARIAAETQPLADALQSTKQVEVQLATQLASARRDLAKWQAAQMNVGLHAARDELAAAEAERDAKAAAVLAAKGAVDHRRALLAAAEQELAAAPQRIAEREQVLATAQQSVVAARAAVEAGRATAAEKSKPAAALDLLLAELRRRSAEEPANAELSAAAQKADESLAHLRADVAAAESAVTQRTEAVTTAEAAVTAAQQELIAERTRIAEAPRAQDKLRADLLAAEAALAASEQVAVTAEQHCAALRESIGELDRSYRARLAEGMAG